MSCFCARAIQRGRSWPKRPSTVSPTTNSGPIRWENCARSATTSPACTVILGSVHGSRYPEARFRDWTLRHARSGDLPRFLASRPSQLPGRCRIRPSSAGRRSEPPRRDVGDSAAEGGERSRCTCWWTARAWKKLHLATDPDTGRIVASALTDHDAGDGSQTNPLLDRIDGPATSFTAVLCRRRRKKRRDTMKYPATDCTTPPQPLRCALGTVFRSL